MRNLLLTAFLLIFVQQVQADPLVRPDPKELRPYASPATGSKTVAGETEGALFLKSLSPEVRATLEKEGQVLLGDTKKGKGKSYAGFIKAVALFKVSKARAYELIVEPVKQPLYLPRLVSAKSIDAPQNGENIQFHLKVLFTKIHFRTRHWFFPEYSRVEWKLDPKFENDIADQEGFWQLYSVSPDLTVGEYGTLIDTGMAVPASIQEFLARRDIPSALTAFRAYVDSDGKFRRDD